MEEFTGTRFVDPKSLSIGDEVNVKEGVPDGRHGRIDVITKSKVARITPSGQIVLENGKRFKANYANRLVEIGAGYHGADIITDEAVAFDLPQIQRKQKINAALRAIDKCADAPRKAHGSWRGDFSSTKDLDALISDLEAALNGARHLRSLAAQREEAEAKVEAEEA